MNERRTRIRIGLFLPLLAFTLLAGGVGRGQVLIYQMDFSKTDDGINFEIFDRAYFVGEALGGQGSFVFTYRENGRDFYTAAEDSGEIFYAVRKGDGKAVIRATAENGTALSHYLVTGDLKSTLSMNLRGQRVSFRVANHLRGMMLASDSEEDITFTPTDNTLGFSGSASIHGSLEHARTRNANKLNQSVSEAFQDLLDDLERMGISSDTEPEEPEDDTDTDTGDDTETS